MFITAFGYYSGAILKFSISIPETCVALPGEPNKPRRGSLTVADPAPATPSPARGGRGTGIRTPCPR